MNKKRLIDALDWLGEWAAFGGLVAADLIYALTVWFDWTFTHGWGWLFWLERNVEGPLLLVITVWAYWAIRRRKHA